MTRDTALKYTERYHLVERIGERRGARACSTLFISPPERTPCPRSPVRRSAPRFPISRVGRVGFLSALARNVSFVLMVQPICELIQERCESNWRLKSLEMRFASGLVGKPRQVVLSLIDSPEAMAKMPGA